MRQLVAFVVIAGVVTFVACSNGKGGADTGSGAAGSGGAGIGGSGGGGAGTGGTGGTPLTTCPTTARPMSGAACTGAFICTYNDACNCNGCCQSTFVCMNDRIVFLGSDDGCFQRPCPQDAGQPDTRIDAASAACTFGQDQTCNDNPIWSAVYGRCTDAGTCVCSDAGMNADSGRCLMPAAGP